MQSFAGALAGAVGRVIDRGDEYVSGGDVSRVAYLQLLAACVPRVEASSGLWMSLDCVRGRARAFDGGGEVCGCRGGTFPEDEVRGLLASVGQSVPARGGTVASSSDGVLVSGGEVHGDGEVGVRCDGTARVRSGEDSSGETRGVFSELNSRSVGGVSSQVVEKKVGKWRRKNEKKKERRREREASDVGSEEVKEEVSWRVPRARVSEKTEAQKTLEAKWVVENKLKMAEATRKLQLLEMQDVSEVAKLQERKVKAAGERALVQIEKSHATLAATGNVPGVVPKGGYCTTIVDDPGLSSGSTPSCTISPDSSASMQEFRELQKGYSDLERKLADAMKLIKRREIMDKATYAQSVAEFTAGSESVLSDGLKRELDGKFGKNYEYDGRYEGKHVVRRVFDVDGMDDEGCDGLEDVY